VPPSQQQERAPVPQNRHAGKSSEALQGLVQRLHHNFTIPDEAVDRQPNQPAAHLTDHDEVGWGGFGGGHAQKLPQVNHGEEGPFPGDHLLSLGVLDLLRADFEDLLDGRDGEGVPLVADCNQKNRHHH
jgi:hypothetical protein